MHIQERAYILDIYAHVNYSLVVLTCDDVGMMEDWNEDDILIPV